MLTHTTVEGQAFLDVMNCGSRHTSWLNADDPIEAENTAIRILAQIYGMQTHQRVNPTYVTTDPLAFGLSEEFTYWDIRAGSIGAIWYLSPDMEFIVGF